MNTFRTPAMIIQLSESSKVEKKVQLFRTGSFVHSEYGKFEITPDALKSMVANFNEKIRGIDLAIDYSHENQSIAAGWIKGLELSEDGLELWALVEWTPNGERVLSEKEFRYLSPEFTFEYQDNESLKVYGPTLLGAGLTNRPTIKKMDPVVQLSEANPAHGTGVKPQNKLPEKKGVQPMDYKAMDPAMVDQMSPEQMKAALLELIAKMKELEGAKAAAEEKVACMDKEKKLSERKQAFSVLLTEGKAVKAQEEAFLAGDMDKFISLAAPLNLSEQGQGAQDAGTQGKTAATAGEAQDQVIELAEKLISDKKAKTIGEAISLVLSENPELNKKIYG